MTSTGSSQETRGVVRRSVRWRLARAAATVTAVAALVVGTLGLSADPAEAVPIQGATPWSVLLCKFKGMDGEPQPVSFYRDLLTDAGAGQGGAQDYFTAVSRGRMTLRGSTVRGWFRLGYTLQDSTKRSRWDRIQDCVSAARAGGYTVPSGHRVLVAVNGAIDSGAAISGASTQVYLGTDAQTSQFAFHEMLHSYGLSHSYSNDTSYQNASWSAPGEYDDEYDLMSAMNTFWFWDDRFGQSAIGLNAYHLDKLGWLPANRVTTAGATGRTYATYTLSALETPETPGFQLVRIPFDPADLNHYYTVEFRRATGVSAPMLVDKVLIHEVKGGTAYLLRNVPTNRDPLQSLNANGVQVTVVQTSGNTAKVDVRSDIVNRCLQGYVWRDAKPGDTVCVTGETRTRTAVQNAAAYSRWVNGPYGPHTCVAGYVWREAFAGDDVCVTGTERSQAAADNAAAASRRNPARLVTGPNTCADGYVWRWIDNSDYVCVTPLTQAAAALDNAQAASRWVNGPYGPHTCVAGYVWREAFPRDDVCVTGARRSQAAADNAAAATRVKSVRG